jgi:hypothetical protein
VTNATIITFGEKHSPITVITPRGDVAFLKTLAGVVTELLAASNVFSD